MAAQQEPDLVVLDLGLPRRDGVEVLETLRRELPSSLVMVLTGRSDVRSVSAVWILARTTLCSSPSAFMN